MSQELTAFITALAAWKWAAVVVVGLVLFRSNIGRLIDRLAEFEMSWKTGIKGKTRELHEAAARVEKPARIEPPLVVEPVPTPKALPPVTVEGKVDITLAGESSPSTPKAPPPVAVEGKADIVLGPMTLEARGTVVTPTRDASKLDEQHEVAAEAGRSPKAALVLLSADIERNLRELLAATGWHGMRRVTSIPVGFQMLAENAPVSQEIRDAVLKFWDVRNRLVHGGRVQDDDVISAVDSGMKILKAVSAIPREVNVVYHPGADLFSDPKGERPVTNAKALILETTGPTPQGATLTKRRVYPTTLTGYRKGQIVAWEWSNAHRFGESWYRDPDTGEIEYAWTASMEFVGRSMEDTL